MGRYVGSSINKGSGGGGGSGTIVQTDSFTRATGIATDANNNVTEITVGTEGNKYTAIKYNNVGLITAYNETISDNTKGWKLEYDSQNLVTSITEVDEWASYSAASNVNSVNEGGTVSFTVTTTLIPDGTTLYYDTSLDDADFSGSTENGSFTINSNSGSFSVTLANDVTTEGAEILNARLYDDSGRTNQVATSNNVTVNDTSLSPAISGVLFHAAGYNQQTTHSWTVPGGVDYISVVCVGGGGAGESQHDGASGGGGGLAFKNSISVTAGQTVTVYVGGGGFATSNQTNCPDGNASFISYNGTSYAVANGGRGGDGNQSSNNWYDNSNSFPNTNSDGGGMGGAGFHGSGFRSGGGGAGGYSGGGNTGRGRGCNRANYTDPEPGQNGGGGGGNGSNGSSPYYSGGGGGTGVYGQGTDGDRGDANGNSSPDSETDYAGKGGSPAYTTGLRGYCVESNNSTFAYGSDLGNNYNRSTQASFHGSSHTTPDGGFPGGGGGGGNSGSSAGCGGHGVVRIVYGQVSGANRTFPTTNVDMSTQYTGGTAETTVGTQLMY